MPKNIEPLNGKLVAPEAIPDRSRLFEAYKQQPKTDIPIEAPASAKLRQNGISLRDGLIINILIISPYIISYLSIRAIYSMNYISMSVLQDRLNMMLLTALMLVTWYIAFRVVRRYLSKRLISPMPLVIFYLFFIFPVIDVSIKLAGKGLSDVLIFPVTFILSQVYIWTLIHLLRESKVSASTVSAPLVIVLAIICIAIFL